jgi:hypothetical protein
MKGWVKLGKENLPWRLEYKRFFQGRGQDLKHWKMGKKLH